MAIRVKMKGGDEYVVESAMIDGDYVLLGEPANMKVQASAVESQEEFVNPAAQTVELGTATVSSETPQPEQGKVE
jgi:hypothetical protein